MPEGQNILLSIVVPTYNRAHMIAHTVRSVLSQTYSDFELIIVDDGSTDATEQVVQEFLSDKVFYYKKENAERSAARNFGTNKAKGEYLNWFDSDDTMFPDHLQQAVNTIAKYNRPEFFSVGFQYEDESGNVVHESNFSSDVGHDFHKGNQLTVDSVFVRKDIALSNPFNEDRALSGSEDYELWMRLSAKYHLYTSPVITVRYIHHSGRSTILMSDPDRLISRYTKFIHYTTSNKEVVALLGKNKGYFVMKNYLLLAVDLAINDHLRLGLKYLLKGFSSSPAIIFEKGFYAFFKHFLRHSLS
jgi:glycosyltransferase involved in cell wall biosynthesis